MIGRRLIQDADQMGGDLLPEGHGLFNFRPFVFIVEIIEASISSRILSSLMPFLSRDCSVLSQMAC